MPELETFVPQSENLDQLRIKVLRITEPDNTPEQIRDMYDSWSNTFETVSKPAFFFSKEKRTVPFITLHIVQACVVHIFAVI